MLESIHLLSTLLHSSEEAEHTKTHKNKNASRPRPIGFFEATSFDKLLGHYFSDW